VNRLADPARKRRRVAIDAAMFFIIVLLMVQMWLLTAALESFLAGHTEVALPAFLASLVLFVACAALYVLVIRLDTAREPDEQPARSGPWSIG
jgi:TRAP-type C4-dicarboxylate transport system permease small subunit